MTNGAPAPIDAALQRGAQPNPRRAPIQPDTRTIKVPLDANPGSILGEGPSAASGRLALESIHKAWTDIAAAAADETVDLPRLADVSTATMTRVMSSVEKSMGSIQSHMAALSRDIDTAIMPLQRDPALASQIREYWRANPNLGELAKAVAADSRTSAAVLSAPGYLSGLDAKSVDAVRQAAVAAHASEKQSQLDEAGASLRKLNAAAGSFKRSIEPRVETWRQEKNAALKSLEAQS